MVIAAWLLRFVSVLGCVFVLSPHLPSISLCTWKSDLGLVS